MSKLILAASAALLIAGPALAETVRTVDGAPSAAVSTKGVNFNNPAEVKRFYSRLRVAVAAVCSSGSATDAACARDVTAQAVHVANRPTLTALYNAQGDSSRAFAGNDQ